MQKNSYNGVVPGTVATLFTTRLWVGNEPKTWGGAFPGWVLDEWAIAETEVCCDDED